MKLGVLLGSEGCFVPELKDFMQGPGSRYFDMEVEDFCKKETFDRFKVDLRHFALDLSGKARLSLYQQVMNMVEDINYSGKGKVNYNLKNCFLSDPEVDLIIMKELQGGMTQSELAGVLKCTRQALDQRMADLQTGVTLGDMSVKLVAKYGGKLESTVHPVLLPLSLSEVYLLLTTLGKTANSLDADDPHGVFATEIGQKIYYQLTDYAKQRIDPRLQELGIDFGDGLRPAFVEIARGDLRHESVRYNRIDKWLYFEKSGAKVIVDIAGEDGVGASIVGVMAPSHRPEEYPRLLAGRNPLHCFCLRCEDGRVAVLSWADVVDIRKGEFAPV